MTDLQRCKRCGDPLLGEDTALYCPMCTTTLELEKMTSPRTVSVLGLVCNQGKQISDLRAELYKVQQQLSLAQKAVEALARFNTCPLDWGEDIDCVLTGEESINREEEICLECKLDYAYAKAKEQEERDEGNF